MERCTVNVILSQDHLILSNDSYTLWCNRSDGRLTAGREFHQDCTLEYMDLGKVWGIVGKICFFTDGDWKLVVVTQASCVGVLPHGGEVYCVDKIGILPLTTDSGLTSEAIGMELPESSSLEQSLSGPQAARALGVTVADKEKTKEMKEREKVEKRLTEALLGMFNDSRSFYFSLNSDLTLSLQRQLERPEEHEQLPLWKQMDERFFWNKWMLSELLDDQYHDPELSSPWILPLIQGYVEVRDIPVQSDDTLNILQPGWSAQYREERERFLRESEGEHRARRGLAFGGSMEVEMQDMASISEKELLVPLQDMGLYYKSGSDTCSSSGDEPSDFLPPKFTSDMVKDGALDVRKIPALRDGESTADRGQLGNSNLPDALQQQTLSPSLGDQEVPSRTPQQVVPQQRNSISQDSESTLCTSLEGSRTEDAEPPHTQSTHTGPELCNSVVDDSVETSGEVQTDASSSPHTSSPARGANDKEDRLSSSNSAASLFYTSQEIPGDGVVIDIFESTNDMPEEGPGMRLPLNSEDTRTHGGLSEGVTIHEFPPNLEDVGPMGNPFLDSEQEEKKVRPVPSFTLVIISRRSCHRAGTRYKRRGVDAEGHVANYVETELVLKCGSHVVSYVVIRGSVPVYWSQPGNKYRPIPVIENKEDTQEAFKKHFDMQLDHFKEMVAVNLVKQTGREKLVGDAFEDHVVKMDNPLLSYVAFDFHQSYKENQNLALEKLIDGTAPFIKQFKYCWIDTAQSCGPLCKQEGVFRVNCMDCLDRTNVVESILSREVLQIALQKLGVIPFEEKLGGPTLISYQEMWANNGDIISKQYAGTAAMKGDITRYGERRISGLMKDGYNSAHRYYLNVFRDSYRQVLIDLMQGVNPFEAFTSLPRSLQGSDELDDGIFQSTLEPFRTINPVRSNVWSLEKEMAMAEMITVCKKELFPSMDDLPPPSPGLCGWVLMEADGYSFLGDSKEEEPCVLMHSKEKAQLCIAKFCVDSKRIFCFLRIPMSQVHKIIIGQLGTIIRNTKRPHMRIHYSLIQDTNFYFTFTTANFISIAEDKAVLVSIAELLARMQPSIIIQEQKIVKKKSLPHQGVVYLMLPDISPFSSISSASVGGGSLKSHDSNHLANPIKARSSISKSLINRDSHDDNNDEEEEESTSAPNSPKPKSLVHLKLSHSYDDLLSNKDAASKSSRLLTPETHPSITVTSPHKRANEAAQVSPSLYEGLDESDDDEEEEVESGSDLDVGIFDSDNLHQTQTNLLPGSVNPLANILYEEEGSKEVSGDEGESRVELKSGDDSDASGLARRFSRLKGKLLQTVKSSKSNFLSRPRSHSPQASSDDVSSLKSSPSPGPLPEAEASEPDLPQQQQKVAASLVKQRFKSSPSLFRRSKKGIVVAPSEEELTSKARAQARENSKSQIIYI